MVHNTFNNQRKIAESIFCKKYHTTEIHLTFQVALISMPNKQSKDKTYGGYLIRKSGRKKFMKSQKLHDRRKNTSRLW